MITRAKEKVKKAFSRRSRSSRSSSSSRDNMSDDSGHRSHASQEEEEIPAVPRSRFRIRILTMVEQIIYKNDYEWQALELLKRQTYALAKRFETRFLIMTGLLQDMNQAFTSVGWENFADIVEPGSHLLTMEFLMSLTVEETSTETKVYFRFFNEQFEITLQQFSVALGFNKRCILDPNTLVECYQYDHSSWWSEISNEPVSSKNNIVSIHNPTLRFLAKWLAMVVHSRTVLRLCSLPELQCLYAMVNKIRFSPIRSMLAHWQKMITGRSPIDITHWSLVWQGMSKRWMTPKSPSWPRRRRTDTRSVLSILCKG